MITRKQYVLLAFAFIIITIGFFLNNQFLYGKIAQERKARVLELDQQIKNLQSRIDLNTSRIENLEKSKTK